MEIKYLAPAQSCSLLFFLRAGEDQGRVLRVSVSPSSHNKRLYPSGSLGSLGSVLNERNKGG